MNALAGLLEPRAAGRAVQFDSSIDQSTGMLTAHLHGPPGLSDPFAPTPYRDFLPPDTAPPIG